MSRSRGGESIGDEERGPRRPPTGQAELHNLELEHLVEALSQPTPAVIAPAASTMESPELDRILAEVDPFVVLLGGDANELFERTSAGGHRREMTSGLFAATILHRRKQVDGLADLEVETTAHGGPEQTAELIMDHLRPSV